jgi:predicted O-linked N-acetylglucosamine transferase (SPINDLY family)
MDYCIVDNIAVPEIEQDFFTEKLIYMPKCYQPNDAKQPVSDKIFTRNELGFENDDFIFCSFNATWKIDIKIFTSWIKILNMVPNAKIWLMYSSDEATNNIINFVNSKGIDASRIVFANSMNKDEHLARLKIADLFLDTTYCNAHTTASDALFAGVPVLTIKGNSFATRVAESLLINIGLDDMVVDSEEDYVNKAIYLSTNKNELDDIKKRLQQNKNVFPLFDTVGFAKDLEALLKTVI